MSEVKVEVLLEGLNLQIGDYQVAHITSTEAIGFFDGGGPTYLDRQHVRAILPYLQRFADTGRFDEKPEPKYRAYTPVEAAAHLGREFEWRHRIWYLAAVAESEIQTSFDDGVAKFIKYADFATDAKWRDNGTPCGVRLD